MRVREIDHGYGRFMEKLEELARDGARVTVGVHLEDGKEIHDGSRSNQTVGEVALATEMTIRRVRGSRKKQGAWLRKSVAQLKRQLGVELRDAAADVLKGATVEYAFAAPGRTLLEKMRDLVPVDTGQLQDSLHVQVRGRQVA